MCRGDDFVNSGGGVDEIVTPAWSNSRLSRFGLALAQPDSAHRRTTASSTSVGDVPGTASETTTVLVVCALG